MYAPLAHWVWAVDATGGAAGWLGKMNAIDFAGGTAVHIAAGVSGLAAILVLRKRLGYPQHALHPNSMVLTLTGAGLLWFGWFGFNGGSALASNALAVSALTATQVAAAAAALSWMLVEWWHRGKPTALGLASGLVPLDTVRKAVGRGAADTMVTARAPRAPAKAMARRPKAQRREVAQPDLGQHERQAEGCGRPERQGHDGGVHAGARAGWRCRQRAGIMGRARGRTPGTEGVRPLASNLCISSEP